MPNTQLGQIDIDFVNSLKATATMGGSTSGLTTPVNYSSISALDAALQAANGTYYTTAKLDATCVNDKVFALRSIQDKTTISDYMPTSTA
jgi:hypothetical protein